MSKWILPTTKGVETFPQVIRSPLAIRFEGVPRESPLARELYSILQGKIGAFYVRAAHAHSLGITDSSYRFQVTPEMAIRYHNNQGHETLHVKAGREIIEQAIRQANENYWSWALIEISVPHMGTNIAAGARFRADRISPAPHEPGLLFGGSAYSFAPWSDGLREPIISFGLEPPWEFNVTEEADHTQIGSLLVDLRPIPRAVVILDLYGFIGPESGAIPVTIGYIRSTSTTSTQDYNIVLGNSDFIGVGLADPRWPGYWDPPISTLWPYWGIDRTFSYPDPTLTTTPLRAYFHQYVTSLPSGSNAYFIPAPSETATPLADGTLYVEDPDYHDPSGLLVHDKRHELQSSPLGGSTWQYYDKVHENFYSVTPLIGFVDAATIDSSQLATISGIGGFNWLDWTTSEHEQPSSLSFSWQQWERRSLFPTRMGLVPLGTATVPSSVDDSYTKLGRVIIDPVRKSISFASAQ